MNEHNEWNSISDDKNKPRDFLKGFGLGLLILLGVAPLLVSIVSLIIQLIIPSFDMLGIVGIAITVFTYLSSIITFLCIGRWKFALGLISVILIPVAIFGGCLLLLS